MRTDLVFKTNATMDVYAPAIKFDIDADVETTVEWKFSHKQVGYAATSEGTIYFTCRQELKQLSRISHIVDDYGTSLSPTGYMYIQGVKAQMDFTGRVIGWRYTLRDSLPRDFADQVAAMEQFVDLDGSGSASPPSPGQEG